MGVERAAEPMQQKAKESARFPSKRDLWISAMIWVGSVMCVASGVAQLSSSASLLLRIAVLILLFGSAGFMLWVLYGTDYAFSGQILRIRCGPFSFRVPLAEVVSVERSRNPLSSPACSLDRLLIRYGRRRVLISPEDRGRFLDTLVQYTPHLVRRGDSVVASTDA